MKSPAMLLLSHHFPHHSLLFTTNLPHSTKDNAKCSLETRTHSSVAALSASDRASVASKQMSPPHKTFLLHPGLAGKENLHANKPHQFPNQNEVLC